MSCQASALQVTWPYALYNQIKRLYLMCFVLQWSTLITVACLLSASCCACCNSQHSAGMFPCRSSIHTHWHAAHAQCQKKAHTELLWHCQYTQMQISDNKLKILNIRWIIFCLRKIIYRLLDTWSTVLTLNHRMSLKILVTLNPPGGINFVVDRSQHGKNLMLTVIDRCQNKQCITTCYIWGYVAADWSECPYCGY